METIEIKQKFVTLEQAKWLHEICKINVYYYWIVSNNEERRVKATSLMYFKYSERYPSPEQWQVVEWLRINHGIWINITAEVYTDGINYLWQIINLKDYDKSTGLYGDNGEYNLPEEACSAAFDYIKNKKLI